MDSHHAPNFDKTNKKPEVSLPIPDDENDFFVEDWNEIEVNIIEDQNEKTEKKQQKKNDYEVQIKINEEFDYLFEICKGFSDDFAPDKIDNHDDFSTIENPKNNPESDKNIKKYMIFQNSSEKSDRESFCH